MWHFDRLNMQFPPLKPDYLKYEKEIHETYVNHREYYEDYKVFTKQPKGT